VAHGSRGLVEVTACGVHHRIEVSLDRIAQKPAIGHSVTNSSSVKSGTRVRIHWAELSCSKPVTWGVEFYRARSIAEALTDLVGDFAAFNPHASFRLDLPDRKRIAIPVSNPAWRKWRADQPTSPHWYTSELLRALMAAYISHENGGPPRTVRDFVAEFAGLAGTQYRKRVLDDAQIGGTLRDMVVNGEVPLEPARQLLAAMRKHSRVIKPTALGVIGEEHVRAILLRLDTAEDSLKYKKVAGFDDDGLPYVIEIGFGIRNDDDAARRIVAGLNWSPVLKLPSGQLSNIIADSRIDAHDPVILLVHQVCPRFNFVDHGKGAIAE
jgi:hypothetical protein